MFGTTERDRCFREDEEEDVPRRAELCPSVTPPKIPLIGDGGRRAPFAKAFRHLRTNITSLSADRPVRRIAITSPGPGERKDTVSANLAITLAQLGKRVLLVDCDLRKLKLFWVFHPETPFGLTEMLVEGMPVDQVTPPKS